ncbi:MAG: tetratricopeptide repeat protein, partial [Candidatus Aminicenantia bacterium]
TLIVIAGDHGESLGEHGELQHGFFLYESVLRVPFIIFKERVLPSGKVVKTRVRLIDIMPTIFSLLNVDYKNKLDGIDLKPIIKGKKKYDLTSYIETMYPEESMHWSRLFGIIKDEWKLIVAPEPELYNIFYDPEEKINLYASETQKRDALYASLNELISSNTSSSSQTRKLSSEELEKLQSLGYISSEKIKKSNTSLPDPKKRIEVVKIIESAQISQFENKNLAVELYKKLISFEPYCIFGYTSLAEGYMEFGNYTGAIDAIKKGLELMPDSYFLWETLGKINFRIGNLEDAFKAFGKALELNKDNFDSLYFSGWILNRLGKNKEALSMFERALKIEPENKSLQQDYAMTMAEIGKANEAISILQNLIKNHPEDPLIYRDIALCYLILKDYQRAISIAEKALEIKQDRELYRVLALIYDELGEKEKALKYLKLYKEERGN